MSVLLDDGNYSRVDARLESTADGDVFVDELLGQSLVAPSNSVVSASVKPSDFNPDFSFESGPLT